MKLRSDLISMWDAGMILQGSSGAVGQPAGPDALGRGGVMVPVVESDPPARMG